VGLLIKGGWVMLPLMLCSLAALTVIIERTVYFKRIRARENANTFLQLVAEGEVREALDIAQGAKSPILRVLSAGIKEPSAAVKAMEVAAITEIAAMKRGIPVLDTIITLSPLLGLLGTIVGMINSFQVMAVGGMGQPHAVTGGVAEALIATATGISIAVITLIPHNYFVARMEQETEAIEQYATRLEVVLTKAPRSEGYENSKKYA
jgi:biopolymer transport protein ExbB